MKLPDLNVLLYAVNSASYEHETARTWLEQALDSPRGVGFAWIVLIGFVRLSTRRGILSRPLAVEQALRLLSGWIDAPNARILHPTERHAAILGRLLLAAGTAGNLATDAHLAALAVEHRVTLGTFDRDFERFAGLDLEIL